MGCETRDLVSTIVESFDEVASPLEGRSCLPIAKSAQRALNQMRREAQSVKLHTVWPEHLLLAMVRKPFLSKHDADPILNILERYGLVSLLEACEQ